MKQDLNFQSTQLPQRLWLSQLSPLSHFSVATSQSRLTSWRTRSLVSPEVKVDPAAASRVWLLPARGESSSFPPFDEESQVLPGSGKPNRGENRYFGKLHEVKSDIAI